MPLHGMTQAVGLRFRRGGRGIGKFRLDHVDADHFFRIQRRQPADEILQFADVPGPAIPLQPLHRRGIENFRRQPLVGRPRHEVTNQFGDINGALAERRQPDRHDVQAEVEILAKLAAGRSAARKS